MANDPSSNSRIDEATGTEFVGHEWDGIEELDTPMPRWWLWTFYITVVWAIIYTVLYPAWPMLSKATEGTLGWSSRGDLAEQISLADQARVSVGERIAAIDTTKLSGNPELLQQAVAGGAAAFKVNCVQCHGSGAAGNQELGYPNLNDDDWIWGGDMQAIEYSIVHGIRQPGSDQRQGAMPAFEGMFSNAQLDALVAQVQSLGGTGKSNAVGAQLYSENCAICHGQNGEGDRTVGAPRLNDAIWLRGKSADAIRRQILNPKMGAMPAWGERLDPVTIKMLTAYVHSLGGGEDFLEAPVEEPVAEVNEQP
ncbi:cytochrome-c oxidase, cbb3-type subunit III [Altererythrobacter arenosus]|uniref:Cbb3-type cytochrome c oxidase subunit n=1 Tax=Altererythrobacter arenosus TaxID=3032592 RepID=A0ABY8FME2_9SPHN|nr:cytochrome-c oxidase, cbb3-type subunit III [Altererythrobacter sp. CAU 1644]WFL76199.1 cytochrome-c oxidase, cbb3-type subunit III [Altererythrobacter sp. CAU 1644]